MVNYLINLFGVQYFKILLYFFIENCFIDLFKLNHFKGHTHFKSTIISFENHFFLIFFYLKIKLYLFLIENYLHF